MGNVESESLPLDQGDVQPHRDHQVTTASTRIEKEEFLNKIDQSLLGLADSIWKKYTASDVLEATDYHKLLQDLKQRSDKLLYLLDLFNAAEFTLDDLSVLITWLCFGQEFEASLRKVVFKPILSLEPPVPKETVYNRLRVMFSDYAEDLTRIVYTSLTGNNSISTTFDVSTELTDLLDRDILRILGLILASPFKRPNPTRLGNIAPLELEQLSHIHCLYNSKKHGFSITRIKELAFDYEGPLILLIKAGQYLFCLASDQGLKDAFKPYGAENSSLWQILPELTRLVSGRSAKKTDVGQDYGIIYSNFTLKTARRGFLVGHQPLSSPALAIDEGFTSLQFAGGLPIKLTAVEIWAAGPITQADKLAAQRAWELGQVNKEKNRKIKLDEDWRESADRHLLSMAGVDVRHSETLGEPQTEQNS